ncbi:MAG: hypothetical protein ACE5JP_10415 [Candidatus Bipolaricaulia bacterium]
MLKSNQEARRLQATKLLAGSLQSELQGLLPALPRREISDMD